MIAFRAVILSATLTLGAFLVSNCGGSTDADQPKLSDYDRSCSVDSECVAVNIGVCSCSCDLSAINQKDVSKFQADTQSCGATCGACPPLPAFEPYCNAGSCALRAIVPDAGTDAPSDGGTTDAPSDAQCVCPDVEPQVGTPCDCSGYCGYLVCPAGEMHSAYCDAGKWNMSFAWDYWCQPDAG